MQTTTQTAANLAAYNLLVERGAERSLRFGEEGPEGTIAMGEDLIVGDYTFRAPARRVDIRSCEVVDQGAFEWETEWYVSLDHNGGGHWAYVKVEDLPQLIEVATQA